MINFYNNKKDMDRINNKVSFCFLISAFCFLLSPFFLFAQQQYIDIDENAQNRIMSAVVFPCDYSANYNLNPVLIENNNQIPAYGLYQNLWDTLFIRSEKLDIPFFENQIKINLVQEGNLPFTFPISSIVLTSYIKNRGRQHTGIDFAVLKNEPVVSCFDGVVRITKKYSEYGNTVVIRHYNGLETVYALLDNVWVKTGQIVKAGELIGYINNTNESKRNVLHFETRFLNEFFNPEKVINFTDRNLRDNVRVLTPNDFIPVPIVAPTVFTQQTDNSSTHQLSNSQTSEQVFHIVKKGDTIYRICAKYNITEKQLRSLNTIKGDHIEIDQKLRIQ
jgi:murein DD-endopeptidase MepM/ murein hydrolase activator NlpD